MQSKSLWTVELLTDPPTPGAGVVIFEPDKVYGGDSDYYYVGKYDVKDGIMKGRVDVTNHTGHPNALFGDAKEFSLDFEGRADSKEINLKGHLINNPELQINVHCIHLKNLN
jgi:hypothetical protein